MPSSGCNSLPLIKIVGWDNARASSFKADFFMRSSDAREFMTSEICYYFYEGVNCLICLIFLLIYKGKSGFLLLSSTDTNYGIR